MSIANDQLVYEFQPSYERGGQIGLYVGLLVGALFWGTSADIVGRKLGLQSEPLIDVSIRHFCRCCPYLHRVVHLCGLFWVWRGRKPGP